MKVTTRENYISGFYQALKETNRKPEEAKKYIDKQVNRLDQLLENISKDTFWEILPEILGIDSKLMVFLELINYEEYTVDEIIQLAEKDYRYYTKELCGYEINMETKHSMIFNLL
ncbi:hypothetical protein A5844_001704 [Enterococcus sp. 10A9_DIV0425]|uniref:Uncharacterized protein n=1 Tax=Candidatus Enterococcus wittei TaxID=1987383 RepID=A0A242JXF7_9ENTE|nr:hypothetical protein [Enterococcus sp. 10A9_DIV0425]OTP10007.1 hypothetical protein A5844_001704 [Enterococcus sp. 10A9_DIV0425]THE12063.1 hypothetical protein E1H99_07820 [Enterococcus hirae]